VIKLPELVDGSCSELVSTRRTRFASTRQVLQQAAATNCTPQRHCNALTLYLSLTLSLLTHLRLDSRIAEYNNFKTQ